MSTTTTTSDQSEMQYDAIFIRFGELFLKGKNKHRFIQRLYMTVQTKVAMFPQLTLEKTNDHILVTLNGADDKAVVKQLNFVFGIHSYALGKVCESTLEAICKTALPVAMEVCKNGGTTKFETRRGWKQFPLDSISISQEVPSMWAKMLPKEVLTLTLKIPIKLFAFLSNLTTLLW